MIKSKPWHRAPALPLTNALKELNWQKSGELSPAAGTAALMLYVALLFMSDEQTADDESERWMSAASYNDLIHATGGMSRSLLSQGLQRLQELGLIQAEGSHQKRRYQLMELYKARDWYKLPCQAIVSAGVIRPFKSFSLRSKHELHAMKLYLYLASVRSREKAYSAATYETIFGRIGIPERDIRKAIALLINCGLLSNVTRISDEDNPYGPNQYYLMGNQKLFAAYSGGASQAEQVPASNSTTSDFDPF